MESKILFFNNAFPCAILMPVLVMLWALTRIGFVKPVVKWISSVVFRIAYSRYCPLFVIILHLILCVGYVIFNGWPIPQGHDDHSWILLADTFIKGRLTNPSPEFIPNFDTFHILMTPTYASKYPIGQGVILAIGKLLINKYTFGNWLINSLNIYLLYLILRNFSSRIWIFCGLILFSVHPRVLLSDQSYWCIALTFTPVLIFLYEMTDKSKVSSNPWKRSLLLAFSFFLASITRPFESLLFLAVCSILLVFYARVKLTKQCVIGFFIFIIAFFSIHLFYNKAITGSMTKMPYSVHTNRYQEAPIFRFQQPRKLTYTSVDIQKFYDGEIKRRGESLTAKSQILGLIYTLTQTTAFLQLNPILIVGFILYIVHFRKKTRMNNTDLRIFDSMLLSTLATVLFVLAISNYADDHYTAVLWPVYLILSIKGIASLRNPFRNSIALVILSSFIFSALGLYAEYYVNHKNGTPAVNRLNLINATKENTLYLVSYGKEHNPKHEWVYNGTDPLQSSVVFARYLKDNEGIINYFKKKNYKIIHINVFNDFSPPEEEAIIL